MTSAVVLLGLPAVRAVRVHLGVEAGQGDPAEFVHAALGVGPLDDLRAGLAVGELHLVAGDGDDLALAHVGRARRDHLQTYHAALLAADLLDDLVELHVHHVLERLGALRDARDAVVHLELAVHRRRAAGHQLDDLAVFVFLAEHRADADERKAHLDGEIVHLARTHVLAVRIVGEGQRVEEILGFVLLRLLVQGAEQAVVTLGDDVLRLVERLVGEALGEQFVLDAVVPDAVGVGLVLGPGGFLAGKLDGAVAREIELLGFEHLLDLGHAALHALEVHVVDRVGGLEVRVEKALVERVVVLLVEPIDVLLGEEELVVIQRVDVELEQAVAHLVVERVAGVVELLERLGDGQADGARRGRVIGGAAGGERQGEQQRTTDGQGEREFHHGRRKERARKVGAIFVRAGIINRKEALRKRRKAGCEDGCETRKSEM